MIPKLPIHVQICLLTLLVVYGANAKPPIIAKPGCRDSCGNVSIPFPFGIGVGCFLDPWFEIECHPSPTNYSKPFLSKLQIELMEVTIGTYSSNLVTVKIPALNVCNAADTQNQQLSSINLKESLYSFSTWDNVFIMEGCPGSAVLSNQDINNNTIMAGCGVVCNNNNSVIPRNGCYGVECCRAPLLSNPESMLFYRIDFNRQPSSGEAQKCLVAAVIKADSVDEYVGNLSEVPVALIWGWNSRFEPDKNRYATCQRDGNNILSCKCAFNYEGNPYVSDGCQGPADCENCQGYCFNQRDDAGHEIPNKYYCDKTELYSLKSGAFQIIKSLRILLAAAPFQYGLYLLIKRIMKVKDRANFFKRNGGLLLQQQLSSNVDVLERTKVFTLSELNKATDNFNENRILGQGGQGTVYKGMLIDGSIVAIKKSKFVDECQLEQFINEVVVLSRVNHRHVVKLFGCCLEAEVPLLVYEFVTNGTLYQHIHDPDEDFVINWKMRLKIAADSAGAIAYLHSSSSIPIYHRDIKSANILLDEKHRAKVSDFGSSKTIEIDKTHMTTAVQGTMGYLDPEYFRSYQITEKSDVYSFGVVLLELLTSKKPFYRDARTKEQKSLVTSFLFLTQNSRLSQILDPKIVVEATEDEVKSVVELAKRCVSWSGNLRPTMQEVATTLERIIKSPAQVSRWYQEQEDFPIQCAGYDEFDMSDLSDAESMSASLPAGSGTCRSTYTNGASSSAN